jgi:VIT1/CCC1 family predicted Fe2+/Mn2+ transporter
MKDTDKAEHKGLTGPGRGFASGIRELIFGAEDGLVSILGLVTGVAAGTSSPHVVLLAGTAGAISGAIAMAAGNYLGVKSQAEMHQRWLSEEERSIEERPAHEREELEDYFRERGMNQEELDVCVAAVERRRDFILEEMAAHELGIGQEDLANPIWKAWWMFVAFILGSLFPILPYVLFGRHTALSVSVAATACALFGMGAAKTYYTGRNPVRSGLEMLAIAAIAGVAGFLAGHFATVKGV